MHYCDLNLKAQNHLKSNEDQDYIKLVVSCIKDEYYNIALNFEVTDFSKPIPMCTFKPIELSQIEQHLKQDPSMEKHLSKLDQLQQKSRITVVINETKNLGVLQETNKNLNSYDIIAVKTTNEKVFNELCINYECFDIISTDITDRNQFMMKRGHMTEAIKRGLYFEITYGQVLFQQDKKRQVMQNFMRIGKATKGKNLIISSEVNNFLYHRSPFDLVSLFNIFDIKNDHSYHALKQNQLMCIQRAKYRKAYKGTITMATNEDKEYFEFKNQQNNERIAEKKKRESQNTNSGNSDNNNNKSQKILQELKKRQQRQIQKNKQQQQSKINKENNVNKPDIEDILKQEKININKKKVQTTNNGNKEIKQKEEQNKNEEKSAEKVEEDTNILSFTIDTVPNN